MTNETSPAASKLTGFRVAAAILLLLLFNAALHQPFQQPVEKDAATYYYLGQEIGKGRVLYRDAWDHKTPLTPFVASLVYLLHSRFRSVDYITATRFVFISILYATSLVIFLLVKEWTGDRWAAFTASLILAGLNDLMWFAAQGPIPKILMNFTGLLSLWLFQKNRTGAAGFFTGLAFLDWQPGIVFALPFVLHLIHGRKSLNIPKAVITYLAGFLAPVTAFIIYFRLEGALGDLSQAVYFFNTLRVNVLLDPLRNLRDIHRKLVWLKDSHLFFLGAAAFLAYPFMKAFNRFIKETPGTLKKIDLLFLLTLGTTAYSLINFNSVDDTIPFTVLAAIWTGVFSGLLSRPVPRKRKEIYHLLVIAVLLSYTLRHTWNHSLVRFVTEGETRENRLVNIRKKVVFNREYQEKYFRRFMDKDSRILSVGPVEFLLPGEFSNPLTFFTIYENVGGYIRKYYPGGWEKLLKAIKTADPDIIVIIPWDDRKSLKRFTAFLKENNYYLKGWQFKKWVIMVDKKFVYAKAPPKTDKL